MLFRKCSDCKEEKDVSQFYANSRMKSGYNTCCIPCHKAYQKEYKARLRATSEFKAAELAYKKAYRERTVAQRAEYMDQWREKNKQHISQYGKQYRRENKERYNFLCQKRKIDLLNRTPKWLTPDDLWMIEEAYELSGLRSKITGVEHHVDHIIPLRGKYVSGLHVPLNLRVVPWFENQRKTNKFEV